MSKHNKNIEKMVSKDFDTTLRSIVRSSSPEESETLNVYNAVEEENSIEYFTTLDSLKSNYRKKSYGKFEDLINNTLSTLKNSENFGNQKIKETLHTQPIILSDKIFKSKIKSKPVKFLQKFFPSFDYSNIPFEVTSIHHLSYNITIKMEKKEILQLHVTEFYTVTMIKTKIAKRLNLDIEQYSLFYKEKILEGSNLLYSYDIKSNAVIILKKCEAMSIYGIFEEKRFPVTVYSSTSVAKLRKSFSKIVDNIDANEMELMYNDSLLVDYNELHFYNILNNDEIIIVKINSMDKYSSSIGYEVVNDFLKITENLKKCTCRSLRINAITELLQLQIEESKDNKKINQNMQLLREFNVEKNFHHINCFKLNGSSTSINSSVSDVTTTSYSGSDSSLKSMLWAENDRINKPHLINDEYIKIMAECENFKTFKHLLANKIGTKCNLTSVTLLYNYSKAIIRFIGFNDENESPEVERILRFTKLYFKKYFKKEIVKKGGLDAFTLCGSDVD